MKIILSKAQITKIVKNEKNLGFVPTMGAIHMGHVSLIKKSIDQCNKTIVTIFVNKPQFSRKNDFKNYPRILKKDILKLKKLKIDYLFIPKEKQMYPHGPNKNIKISLFSKELCGKFRKGHFKAIADIIDRFLKIIKPKKMFLGEKDFQQFMILEHFVQKNYSKIKVICCKTIREKNGLALSSRNMFLTLKKKKIASNVYKILIKNKDKILNKKASLAYIKKKITSLGIKKIDYLVFKNINKIIKPYKKKIKYKIFIAYYLGKTRLIDNV